jgi:hypothetical protein
VCQVVDDATNDALKTETPLYVPDDDDDEERMRGWAAVLQCCSSKTPEFNYNLVDDR